MKHRSLAPWLTALGVAIFASALVAQDRPTVSPGVGNAVFLAKNSIQIDSGVAVTTGDVIVNNATTSAVYGEAAFSIDRNAHTAAGYKVAATSVDVDKDAAVGGDVYYNTLVNQGTIGGSLFTPLALPVFAVLPSPLARSAGPDNVTVAAGATLDLDEGSYANLVVARGGIVRFTGGGYSFASINADREALLRFAAPSDVVVTGRIAVGRDAYVGPAPSSGVSAGAIRIQADGINGSDGALLSLPASMDFGNNTKVFANLQADAGSIVFGSAVEASGAFIARDILVGRDGVYSLNSGLNQAPVANAQSVFTSGTSPLTITLTGSDPEGSALTFSIVSGPSAGTLSSPSQATSTSATVVYTPAAAGVADAFTFRVRDSGGATGDAVVSINPTGDDPGQPAPTTVIATETSISVNQDVASTLALLGTAPAGVGLTFSIVSGTGPSHGSLGSVTQGTESPQRSASVVYTPDSGYLGSDAFQFQACGVISGSPVCDTASFNITVVERRPDPTAPNLVSDVSTSTLSDTEVTVSLGPTSASFSRRIVLAPHAAVLLPAAIAGNVADSNNDNLGDNHNDLPGPVPVFMSAGVGQLGGDGSNGTTRLHMEFDISDYISTANSLQSATITLPTHRGTTDAADTFFWWVTSDGDGALADSDYEAPAEPLPDATMPVPSGMSVGADGSFTFNVLDQVKTAMGLGRNYFVVQGRVDESQSGPIRGLEVRTTADNNVSGFTVPGLALATPGISPPLVYTITSLPSNGVLRDSANTLITSVPYQLPDAAVRYTPGSGFTGTVTFGFEATNNTIIDAATVTILVRLARCDIDVTACNNGR